MFTAYLNLDFSFEILDLCLDFINVVAKVNSHTQVVSNTCFPITESNISF